MTLRPGAVLALESEGGLKVIDSSRGKKTLLKMFYAASSVMRTRGGLAPASQQKF